MKIDNHNQTLVTSAESRNKLNYVIGDADVVINILRNRLYNNPIQTLVQEYISNAIDANVEVGASAKDVIVQVPTRSEPYFKVRDHGPGLSPSRITDVFVKYGSSTKRTSDKFIGGFGIGAKSAWSYADSFTVKSYHEGTLREYLAHTGENHAGIFELIAESPTSEPNGVEIAVPVKEADFKLFYESIRRMVLWSLDPVTVSSPPHEYSNYLKSTLISQSGDLRLFRYTDEHKFNQPHLIMLGNVPYAVDFITAPEGIRVVYNVPNGRLKVAASRESLVQDEKLKEIVEEINSAIYNHILNTVESKLQPATLDKPYFEYLVEIGSIGFRRFCHFIIRNTIITLSPTPAEPTKIIHKAPKRVFKDDGGVYIGWERDSIQFKMYPEVTKYRLSDVLDIPTHRFKSIGIRSTYGKYEVDQATWENTWVDLVRHVNIWVKDKEYATSSLVRWAKSTQGTIFLYDSTPKIKDGVYLNVKVKTYSGLSAYHAPIRNTDTTPYIRKLEILSREFKVKTALTDPTPKDTDDKVIEYPYIIAPNGRLPFGYDDIPTKIKTYERLRDHRQFRGNVGKGIICVTEKSLEFYKETLKLTPFEKHFDKLLKKIVVPPSLCLAWLFPELRGLHTRLVRTYFPQEMTDIINKYLVLSKDRDNPFDYYLDFEMNGVDEETLAILKKRALKSLGPDLTALKKFTDQIPTRYPLLFHIKTDITDPKSVELIKQYLSFQPTIEYQLPNEVLDT